MAQAAQTDRITDQYTLEKNVSGVWGEKRCSAFPSMCRELECDSPDAAYINDELNAIYAADFREFENSGGRGGSRTAKPPLIGVGWDDWWYGDCVSLVVRSRYGGTARGVTAAGASILPPAGGSRRWPRCCSGWGWTRDERCSSRCSGRPCRPCDREMAQGAYYEGLRLGGELSQNADGYAGIQ
ncbi:MAG: hypothetical protein ACLT9S_00080 [Faecalibacterium sp.]